MIPLTPIPKIKIPREQAPLLEVFKQMDYGATRDFALPIELMMENAGLHLATLIARSANKRDRIKIGVGNGNNGGGGLVAARRLVGWGFDVTLDLFAEITKPLPLQQLQRALKFGASLKHDNTPDIWVDAYLGFSQHLPLGQELQERIHIANDFNGFKFSLDIPTGFMGNTAANYFKADKILTLAAPKQLLYNLPKEVAIFVADLGIPKELYERLNIRRLPFEGHPILALER